MSVIVRCMRRLGGKSPVSTKVGSPISSLFRERRDLASAVSHIERLGRNITGLRLLPTHSNARSRLTKCIDGEPRPQINNGASDSLFFTTQKSQFNRMFACEVIEQDRGLTTPKCKKIKRVNPPRYLLKDAE